MSLFIQCISNTSLSQFRIAVVATFVDLANQSRFALYMGSRISLQLLCRNAIPTANNPTAVRTCLFSGFVNVEVMLEAKLGSAEAWRGFNPLGGIVESDAGMRRKLYVRFRRGVVMMMDGSSRNFWRLQGCGSDGRTIIRAVLSMNASSKSIPNLSQNDLQHRGEQARVCDVN
jgi:hypothetical protein